MTAKTQIYSNSFVELITNPDWWIVLFTAISTTAVIVIAIVQIRMQRHQTQLQKRQTEAQEYSTYRQLYILISSANSEIDGFLFNLNDALWAPRYNIDKDYLKRKLDHLDKLRKDLSDSYVDYELKFPHESFNKNGYYQTLSLMARIVHQTILSIEKNEVYIAEGTQRIPYEKGKEDEGYAVAIAKHFKNGFLAGMLMQNFERFIEQKRALRCDDKFLDKIRERCKID